jgi:4,4'-diaponeurosporenoate glycosyltransferase
VIFALLSLCTAGWLAGFLLLRRIPTLPQQIEIKGEPPCVTVIIPARNEEANLPALLISLQGSVPRPGQVLVVDDHSSDATAEIARTYGAQVMQSAPLPEGWTGKTWACHQGAMAAQSDLFFFLDADTCFAPRGYARTLAYFISLPANAALSVMPFHTTRRPYEQFSLFFNLLTAIGAGGFTGLGRARLFGPLLVIRRDLYLRAGGHEAVRSRILENLFLADIVYVSEGICVAIGGKGAFLTRMFPHGFAQLRESWQKAFATGARVTAPIVLAISIFWLATACLTVLVLVTTIKSPPVAALVLYFAFVLQTFLFASQVGTFRFISALLYPIPLVFYLALFGLSAYSRRGARTLVWRGRPI